MVTLNKYFVIVSVNVVDGENLVITRVSRLHMGAYLCIASNGVPPSVSKRVLLRVQCKFSWLLKSCFPANPIIFMQIIIFILFVDLTLFLDLGLNTKIVRKSYFSCNFL